MFAQVDGVQAASDGEPIKVEIVALPFWKLVAAIVVAQLIVGLLAFLFTAAFLTPRHVTHSSEQMQVYPPPSAPGPSH